MSKTKPSKWIGLAKVVVIANSDILDGAQRGFTNVVGFAETKQEFRKEVANKLLSMELKLIRLEGAEPLKDRLNKFTVSKEIIKATKTLLPNANTVVFSTFHTY